MPKINKVVTTVWYNKQNMHDLRRVFPDAEFVYVDFYDKERLTEEVKDADVAIVMGDVDPCLLGENSLKWIQCDHAGLNGSARPEVFARGIPTPCISCSRAAITRKSCLPPRKNAVGAWMAVRAGEDSTGARRASSAWATTAACWPSVSMPSA